MKKHVKIFFDHYKLDISDVIICQWCENKQAVDIHHIDPKGMGGRKSAESIDNLIALCRDCHNKAHDNKISRYDLKLKLNL